MSYYAPHEKLESLDREIAVVDEALSALYGAGVLSHVAYDHERLLALRRTVRQNFDIPWTSITPRTQRLLYAINAILKPATMVAAGVFCGNTFISNAGAAVGPGACYEARNLIGVEIKPEEAARGERNIRTIDPTGLARVVAADAVAWVAKFQGPIHLLYLDAKEESPKGKGIYLDILEACYDSLPQGGVVLAHDSVSAEERLAHYLAFARDEAHFRISVNVVLDMEGLEVSVK